MKKVSTNQRGINIKLVEAFKASNLYRLVTENPNVFLTCIRNNYISIYHNADSVAKVNFNRERKLKCEINSYFLGEAKEVRKGNNYIKASPDDIVEKMEVILRNSEAKTKTEEKKAQQQIFYQNNNNANSSWFCVDIEYVQSRSNVRFRFDLVAISKSEPHRIAIIELKYNSSAIGGKAGVSKHILDFKSFNESELSKDILREECSAILKNYKELGIQIPETLNAFTKPGSFKSASFEYYIICLYDESISPKGTVGGYLFDTKRDAWGTQRVSTANLMKKHGIDVESDKCPIKVKFLFKKVKSPQDINITEILDKTQYDK
jgi:hypothetical protein